MTTTKPTFIGITPDKGSVEEAALNAILVQRRHVLLHGSGGTGKSFFITQMVMPANEIRRVPNVIALTAPTGVAASLLGGVTIHSWAGLGIGMSQDRSRNPDLPKPTVHEVAKQLSRRLFGRQEKVQEIREANILLIDEISMMGAHLFDLADQVLRAVRGVMKPFGGLQLILLGDVMQLAPVEEPFFFHSKVWKDLCGGADPNSPSHIDFFVFNKCRRFNNDGWFNLLGRVRMGTLTHQDKLQLQDRMISVTQEQQMKDIPFITGRRNTVDNENFYRQNELPGPDYHCRAHDYLTDSPTTRLPKSVLETVDKHFMATTPKTVTLRVGARVMLRKNMDFDEFYVNGSTGTVVAIDANMGTGLVPDSTRVQDPPGPTVRRVLVQFDKLLPALQAIVERRREKNKASELSVPIPTSSQPQYAQSSLVKRSGTPTSSVGLAMSTLTLATPQLNGEVVEEKTVPTIPPIPPPIITKKPGPLEEDYEERRIWIHPVSFEVTFNKQMLGIKRTVVPQFEGLVNAGEFMDIPETGNKDEDDKMRALAATRKATVKVSRAQVPLVLAYSLTIHKVQGCTFTSGVKMDLGRDSIFTQGMAYVLLSRSPSIDGVYLTRFDPNKIIANPDPMRFAASIGG